MVLVLQCLLVFFDVLGHGDKEDIFSLVVIVCLYSIFIADNPFQSAMSSKLAFFFFLLSIYFYAMITLFLKTRSIIKLFFLFIGSFVSLKFLFESSQTMTFFTLSCLIWSETANCWENMSKILIEHMRGVVG